MPQSNTALQWSRNKQYGAKEASWEISVSSIWFILSAGRLTQSWDTHCMIKQTLLDQTYILQHLASLDIGSIPSSINMMCRNRPHSWKDSKMLRAWRGIEEDQFSGRVRLGEWKTSAHRSLFHSICSHKLMMRPGRNMAGDVWTNSLLISWSIRTGSYTWCWTETGACWSMIMPHKVSLWLVNFWDDRKNIDVYYIYIESLKNPSQRAQLLLSKVNKSLTWLIL